MTRNEEIHEKGFDITDYSRVKVGVKYLDDAVLQLGSMNKELQGHGYLKKSTILQVISRNDVEEMRAISNFYYHLSGMYERVCNYFADLYRYDWYVAPEILDSSISNSKVLKDFSKVLNYLDKSYIRKICGDIALEIIKNGCYYGYLVPSDSNIVIQQLPVNYCRSRYSVNGMPAVEFNMKYFDTFYDTNYRMRILNLFPSEFKKGYVLYK